MQFILLRIITVCTLVLLPLIPAYIIFNKFPNRTHVSGPFQGLSLNLTGAFAGYFITLLVCAPFIPSIFKAITKQEDVKNQIELFENDKPWTVKAYIKFKNYDNTDLNDELAILSLLHSLNSQISLPAVTNSPNIEFTLPRPSFLFSQSRQLLFASTQPNWLIKPNSLNYGYIEKKMIKDLNEINLDTIIVKLPPPQKVELTFSEPVSKIATPPPKPINQ